MNIYVYIYKRILNLYFALKAKVYFYLKVVSHYDELSMSIEKLVTQTHGRYGSVFGGSRESRKNPHNARLNRRNCQRFIMRPQ